MKKTTVLEFIKKHTGIIEKCRWVSNSKDRTLKVNVSSDTRNLLCDLTLSNWDGFADAEVGIGSIAKFKRELSGLCGDDITTVINYNDDKSRIVSVDVMDGRDVMTITTSDLDMIGASSKLKQIPPADAEIIIDNDFKETFLKGKSALPDVNTFTILMNKKGELTLVIGYSNINSSRKTISVKTTKGLDKVDDLIHFRADYLNEILSANSECGDTVLRVSNAGICSIEFTSGDFNCKYYLTASEDQN